MADRKLDRVVHPPHGGGKPRSLVVMLHGLGANGADLIGLAPHWAPLLPETEFISPDAPEPCDMAPEGYIPYGLQWFSLQDRSLPAMVHNVTAAAAAVDAFLDEVLAERGLDGSRLVLMGFSQGAMMSLHVGLRRTAAAILSYSGILLAGPDLFMQIRNRPPVLLVHGDGDPIVPISVLDAAEIGLRAVGVPFETLRRPGMSHAIDDLALERGGAFLKRVLNPG